MTLEDLQTVVHLNSKEKGFWAGGTDTITQETIAMKLALIHSEVSECLEALRETGTDSWTTDRGKPMGMGPELADVVIRVLDLAEALKIDLAHWIERKHAYNRSRPLMHGKKF